MKEPCTTCGNTDYHRWRIVYPEQMPKYMECNLCGHLTGSLVPDVYFNPAEGRVQTDPNLFDKNGPIPFSSRREKAAILRRLNLQEAGDKVRGSRNFDKAAARRAVEQFKSNPIPRRPARERKGDQNGRHK